MIACKCILILLLLDIPLVTTCPSTECSGKEKKHEKEDIRDTRLCRPCCNHGRSVSHPVQIRTGTLTVGTAAYYSMSGDRT